jgi:hypothetical protein
LLLVAACGICAAYANKGLQASPNSLHAYSYWHSSTDGSRIYYTIDLTTAGYEKGIDYDCVPPAITCTFLGDPTRAHMDLTGTYFYSWDVPKSGFDNTGVFYLLD